MAPLTYSRLLKRLNQLYEAVPAQFPGDDNVQRAKDVQRAIKAGLIAAQAGLEGDDSVLSPGQLKHWVTTKMNDINERCDCETAIAKAVTIAEEPVTTKPTTVQKVSAVTKRTIRNPHAPDAGVKKPVLRRSPRGKSPVAKSPAVLAAVANAIEENHAAAALLKLSTSKSPTDTQLAYTNDTATTSTATSTFGHINNVTTNNEGKQLASIPTGYTMPNSLTSQSDYQPSYSSEHYTQERRDAHADTSPQYTPLPPININDSPEKCFFAGIQYAMRCLRNDRGAYTDLEDFVRRFPDQVSMELGIENRYKPTGEWYINFTCTHRNIPLTSRSNLKTTIGRAFWDVI